MHQVMTVYSRPSIEVPFFFEVDQTYTPVLVAYMANNPLIASHTAYFSADRKMYVVLANYATQQDLDTFLAGLAEQMNMSMYQTERDAYCTTHGQIVNRNVVIL